MEHGPLLLAPESAAAAAASMPPYLLEKSTCGDKVVEFACSACLLCVCCPISMAWCCLVKTPRKIGGRLAQQAKPGGGGGCACGLQRRTHSAAYSSFSDMDSDYQKPIRNVSSKRLKFDHD